jgi:heme A synthase
MTGWALRIMSAVTAVLLFDQAVFAGQFLDGLYPALHTHRENATLAGISTIITALAAVAAWRRAAGPWWLALAYLGLFGLIALQIVLGFARAIAVHIPLGVAIIALAFWIAVWVWRRKR